MMWLAAGLNPIAIGSGDPLWGSLPVTIVGMAAGGALLTWLWLSGRSVEGWLVSLGAIFFLNDGAGASVLQMLYMGALAVVTVRNLVAGRHVGGAIDKWGGIGLPLFAFAAIVVSVTSSIGSGVTISAAVNSCLPYSLILMATTYSLNAKWERSRSRLMQLIGTVALLAVAVSTQQWMTKRGFADGTSLPGSGSHYLILPWVGAGLVKLCDTKRFRYALPAGLYVASLLLAGSRSGVLAALVAIVFAVAWIGGQRVILLVLSGVVAVAAASLGIAFAATAGPQQGAMQNRMEYMWQSLSGDQSVDEDDSAEQRRLATLATADALQGKLLLGAGPGVAPGFYAPSGGRIIWKQGTALDTPIMTIGKVGLVGTLALWLLVANRIRLIWMLAKGNGQRVAVILFVSSALITLPIGSPFENPGFGIGILLLGMLARVESNNHIGTRVG